VFSAYDQCNTTLCHSSYISKNKRKGSCVFILDRFGDDLFLLSFDEMFRFHERVDTYVKNDLNYNATGLLYFAWVIPYGIVGGTFVLLYLRFLMQLPKRTMIMFIVPGAIYVIGAIGFEMLGGQERELYGHTFLYYVLSTFEELFETIWLHFLGDRNDRITR
jgi:hypothetical protein